MFGKRGIAAAVCLMVALVTSLGVAVRSGGAVLHAGYGWHTTGAHGEGAARLASRSVRQVAKLAANSNAPPNASSSVTPWLVEASAAIRTARDNGKLPGANTLLTRWCTTPSGYQAITPCSGTGSAPTGASGSFDFTITNTDPVNDVGYNKSVSCSGVSVTCSTTGSGYVASGGGTTVISVNWTAPASAGTLYATLLMKPNSGTSDTLQATTAITIYTPPTYTVSVTPDGSDVTVSQPLDTTYQFKVSDNGNTNATYALSVSCPGLTCSVPSTVGVTHGSYTMVTVSFNSGSPGATGTVTLSATATGTSDDGSINVVPLTRSVSVTPVGTAINVRAAADTTAPFTVTLDGTASSVKYGLTIACTDPVYDCTGPDSVAVTKGTPQSVTVSYKTRSDLHGGDGTLSLKATS
ncbi:MAG: hypothetical protein ABI119_00515, partial [Gemmatimonadaceae bacterium]